MLDKFARKQTTAEVDRRPEHFIHKIHSNFKYLDCVVVINERQEKI